MFNRLLIPVILGLLGFTSCSHREGVLTITWAVGQDPTGTHQALIRAFEQEHPGIRVKLLEMPASATTQHDAYVTYLAARDPGVDVYAIDIIWPAEFAQAGWLRPLDTLLTPGEREEFLPGPLAGCTYQEKLYAVPWFTDAGVLYYRKDLLNREGLKPPATWVEFQRQSRLLSSRYKVDGYVFQGDQYEGLVCNFLEWLWGNGGEFWDENGKVRLTDPEAVEALAFWRSLLRDGISPRGVLTYKEEEARRAFTSGEVAFMRNWPYAWALCQDSSAGSKVVGKVGLAPLPAGKGKSASCLGGWNLALSAYSRHPREAGLFIKYLTSSPAQKLFALKGGRLPTRKTLYRDPEILARNPYYEALYPVFVNARPRPVSPIYSKLSDLLQVELHRALLGEKTPEKALRAARNNIEAALH